MTSVIADLITSVAVVVLAAIVASWMFSVGISAIQHADIVASKLSFLTGCQLRIVAGYVGYSNITVWVKNVGSVKLYPKQISMLDVLAGQVGNVKYIPNCEYVQTLPCWNYTIVDDYVDKGVLDPGETLQIAIYYTSALPAGNYLIIICNQAGLCTKIVLSKG